MIVLLVIAILIALALSAYAGYKVGSYYSMQLVRTISEQNERLTAFSNAWASAASSTTKISGDVAQLHTQNVNASLQTILVLLGNVQQQQMNKIDSKENEKINDIINRVKNITHHE